VTEQFGLVAIKTEEKEPLTWIKRLDSEVKKLFGQLVQTSNM